MKAQQVYGKRLLINLVDELALNDPERIVYSLAASDNIADGFRHVSARDFANAVDRTAWWLKYELGEGVSFPSIACIFPCKSTPVRMTCCRLQAINNCATDCDFRNILLILGCVKAGYKVNTGHGNSRVISWSLNTTSSGTHTIAAKHGGSHRQCIAKSRMQCLGDPKRAPGSLVRPSYRA